MLTPDQKAECQRRLLEWYGRAKRDLPWRDVDDPYAVLVSEMMLQQTQVATAIPYFERFMATFPTISDLASAHADDVLHCWQGLGYYSRARNLHRAAIRAVDGFDGELPDTVEELRSLPGVGPYTAGAVASIAFRKPAPVVDANVARVLARVFAVPGDPKSGPTSRALWAHAGELLSHAAPHDWNSALMELGALVCRTPTPACDECPIADLCTARARGETERYPELPRRTPPIAVEDVAVLVERGSRVALVRRPEGGRWAGLWELPRVRREDGEALADAALRAPMQVCGLSVRDARPFGAIRHTITRYRVRLYGFRATSQGGDPIPVTCADAQWVDVDAIGSYALASPQRKLLRLAWTAEDALPLR
ncbi:A/G-specific adenine glycosylase [Candidatus Poribacteria bacterium]|nr:A/G-specific adenine glycosylase [Candidatus Poribacteria bacterium]MBT7100438.1 A/G-specific adenine glycosylase [Candidatus Poribacteria bacterium]MBT7804698.1 A/G-specific adenine glycosylase [Candidatus Poribacteria bacterium]